jgi:wyosine [tRNA(Phe)-imidazoG37] synthetase (radical SAM superfamily)
MPHSLGSPARESIEDLWNGETAQRIRRSILDGTFEFCDQLKCPVLQEQSGPVRARSRVPTLWQSVLRDDLTVVPWGPHGLNCAFDRSCNLSCPSCRESLIVETDRADEIFSIQRKLESSALRDLKYLYVTGSGDPFGSPYFRRWLRTLKRSQMPLLEEICLHTNAQLWTEEIWNTFPEEIRQLMRSVHVSIDAATDETYAINRRGGTFARLQESLALIGGLRQAGQLRYFVISMVVQTNNFREMAAFVELGRRFGADQVMFSLLSNWGTYSEEDYAHRAVHLPSHPLHQELCHALASSIFGSTQVQLGNLSGLRPASKGS